MKLKKVQRKRKELKILCRRLKGVFAFFSLINPSLFLLSNFLKRGNLKDGYRIKGKEKKNIVHIS